MTRITLQLDIDANAPATRLEGSVCAGDGAPSVDFAGAFELVTVLERLVHESRSSDDAGGGS